ncbi:hypothetical protein DFH09DRAFT_394915 [Mycena vulgaris]|nr:hypothetical protein DFH09DRAFT_394915 [Mycena vulgaris]
MGDNLQDFCICMKPATNRCSACKNVSYCSQECQRRDWKTHKVQCKATTGAAPQSATAQVGSSVELNELLRVGAQYSIYDDSMALGLDPSLISGTSGAEFYEEKDGSAMFWRLEAPAREQWEAKAAVHNRKSQRFWTTYLDPIAVDRKWVNIVLDAVSNVRLPSMNNTMWQDQVGYICSCASTLFNIPHR